MSRPSSVRDATPFLCSRCGGQLSVREGARISRCAHCGTSFLARGLLRYAVTPGLSPRSAATRVRDLFRGPEAPADLARRAVHQRTDLFFVPYWRFQATVVGRLRGTRTVRRRSREPDSEGGDPLRVLGRAREITREEAVDRPIREIWRATLSACPVEELGVPSLTPLRQRAAGMVVTRALDGIPGLRRFDGSLFDAGTVLDVMLPLDRAQAAADKMYGRYLETRGFDVTRRDLQVLQLQRRCFLLYYPVFRVCFRYGGRIYSVTLDGVQGGVVRAALPIEPRFSIALLLAASLMAGALIALPLRAVLLPPAGLEGLAGLAGSPRFWAAAALGAAGLVGAGRAAAWLPLERERQVRP